MSSHTYNMHDSAVIAHHHSTPTAAQHAVCADGTCAVNPDGRPKYGCVMVNSSPQYNNTCNQNGADGGQAAPLFVVPFNMRYVHNGHVGATNHHVADRARHTMWG